MAIETADGVVVFDLDEDEIVEVEAALTVERPDVKLALPLLVAADKVGATIVALVARRPPLLISRDGGSTWREGGAGLPTGYAIAIAPAHPDLMLYASRSRVHISRDGGRFWEALTTEFHEITAIAWHEV
ncbi:MAG: sialidase family protein [Gaiellaceae bacterium]